MEAHPVPFSLGLRGRCWAKSFPRRNDSAPQPTASFSTRYTLARPIPSRLRDLSHAPENVVVGAGAGHLAAAVLSRFLADGPRTAQPARIRMTCLNQASPRASGHGCTCPPSGYLALQWKATIPTLLDQFEGVAAQPSWPPKCFPRAHARRKAPMCGREALAHC
jgi:hypothetical protein